jgi:excisionase family DNA binding protein
MPSISDSVNDGELVSLRRASELLGVHPATLRSWADQGKIKSSRTAGGHRRFAMRDIRAQASQAEPAPEPRDAQLIVQSALGRARLEVTGGSLTAEAWYRQYDEATRERHRTMGRRLLGLTLLFLNAQDNPAQAAHIQRDAQSLGGEYGQIAAQHGLALAEAMRAFLYFRDFLLESVVQMREVAGAGGDSLRTYRRINGFANDVLIAMVAAFQENK